MPVESWIASTKFVPFNKTSFHPPPSKHRDGEEKVGGKLAIRFLQARQARSLLLGKSGFGSITPRNKLLVCRLLAVLNNLTVQKFVDPFCPVLNNRIGIISLG